MRMAFVEVKCTNAPKKSYCCTKIAHQHFHLKLKRSIKMNWATNCWRTNQSPCDFYLFPNEEVITETEAYLQDILVLNMVKYMMV